MATYLVKLAALAAVIAPGVFGAPAAHLKIRNFEATDVVSDSYIVVYNDQVSSAAAASHLDRVNSLVSKRDTNGVGATYDMDLLKGYQITADEDTIKQIADSPEVSLTCQ